MVELKRELREHLLKGLARGSAVPAASIIGELAKRDITHVFYPQQTGETIHAILHSTAKAIRDHVRKNDVERKKEIEGIIDKFLKIKPRFAEPLDAGFNKFRIEHENPRVAVVDDISQHGTSSRFTSEGILSENEGLDESDIYQTTLTRHGSKRADNLRIANPKQTISFSFGTLWDGRIKGRDYTGSEVILPYSEIRDTKMLKQKLADRIMKICLDGLGGKEREEKKKELSELARKVEGIVKKHAGDHFSVSLKKVEEHTNTIGTDERLRNFGRWYYDVFWRLQKNVESKTQQERANLVKETLRNVRKSREIINENVGAVVREKFPEIIHVLFKSREKPRWKWGV